MSIDPEVQKRAMRAGEPVDTPAEKQSREARYAAIRELLEERKNGRRRENGSTNGRTPSFDSAYRPVGEAPDGDARRSTQRARLPEVSVGDDGGTPGVDSEQPRNLRTPPRSGGTPRRVVQRKPWGPSSGGGPTTGQEVSGPRGVDQFFGSLTKYLRDVAMYLGFDVRGDATALTELEETALIPKVAAFFQGVGGGIDWCVTHANAAHEESDIWEFTDEEAEVFAKIYLKRARKVGWLAEVARQVEHVKDANDFRKAGFSITKRALTSYSFIRENGGWNPWLKS